MNNDIFYFDSTKEKTELSVQKQQEKRNELIGSLHPKSGHSIWEVNTETLEVKLAEFEDSTYTPNLFNPADFNKRIIIKPNCFYTCALKKKTALNNFKNNKNGSRPTEGLLKLTSF